MNAGELRHRVTIQQPVVYPDEFGHGATPAWTPVVTVWASVKPVRAAEVIRAQQPGMETAHTVKMRYTQEMKADRRLSWEGRILYVSGIVDVDGRHTELEIVCNEREPVASA